MVGNEVEETIKLVMEEFLDLLFQVNIQGTGPLEDFNSVTVEVVETKAPVPVTLLPGFYESVVSLVIPVECLTENAKIIFVMDVFLVVNSEQEGRFVVTAWEEFRDPQSSFDKKTY